MTYLKCLFFSKTYNEMESDFVFLFVQCIAFTILGIVIALNLAVGFVPGVDNSAHIGGFIAGFLLGFIFLLRPQYGYVSSKCVAAGHDVKHRKPKYKFYQKLLWVTALVTFVAGYTRTKLFFFQN